MKNPEATVAITLGAATWPLAPDLAAPPSFAVSHERFVTYLREDLGLPPENLLVLFDDNSAPSELVERIYAFLRDRMAAVPIGSKAIQVLLLYYVGHGGFAGSDYLLAIKRTNRDLRAATSLRMRDLAEGVRRASPNIRRYLILDCCFAAAAYAEFMGGPISVAVERTKDAFPSAGTALLCASGARDYALAPKGEDATMFTGALLRALREGDPMAPRLLSLRDVGGLVEHIIREKYSDDAVRPELHTPEQREGDVSLIPLFPNRAARQGDAVDAVAGTQPTVRSFDEGAVDASARRTIDSADAASLKRLAAQYFKRNAWAEALCAYRRLAKLSLGLARPTADAYEKMATIYWRAGDPVKAQQTWALCLRLYDQYMPAERADAADRISAEQNVGPATTA